MIDSKTSSPPQQCGLLFSIVVEIRCKRQVHLLNVDARLIKGQGISFDFLRNRYRMMIVILRAAIVWALSCNDACAPEQE